MAEPQSFITDEWLALCPEIESGETEQEYMQRCTHTLAEPGKVDMGVAAAVCRRRWERQDKAMPLGIVAASNRAASWLQDGRKTVERYLAKRKRWLARAGKRLREAERQQQINKAVAAALKSTLGGSKSDDADFEAWKAEQERRIEAYERMIAARKAGKSTGAIKTIPGTRCLDLGQGRRPMRPAIK